MLENLGTILSIASAVVGLLITTVTFLTKFIKSAKGKKTAENILKIGGVIEKFIKEAEKFVNFSGAEKKAYVMAQTTSFAVKNGIGVDEEYISQKVEELVALTKEVNQRTQDVINTESVNGTE